MGLYRNYYYIFLLGGSKIIITIIIRPLAQSRRLNTVQSKL